MFRLPSTSFTAFFGSWRAMYIGGGLSPFEGAVVSADSSLEKLVACPGCV